MFNSSTSGITNAAITSYGATTLSFNYSILANSTTYDVGLATSTVVDK